MYHLLTALILLGQPAEGEPAPVVEPATVAAESPPAVAQKPPPQKLIERAVVLNLAAPESAAAIATELSELMIGIVREALPGADVTGQSDIKAMLTIEQQKMAVGCEDDTSCLAEIGGALGADHVVTGRLGKVGSVYLLSLKLIYAPRAKVVRHFSEKITGSEEQLIEAVSQGARHLVDGKSPTRAGYVVVEGTGTLFVNGKDLGPAPGRFLIAAGDHSASLRDAAGTEITARRVRVLPYQETRMSAAPVDVEPPPAVATGPAGTTTAGETTTAVAVSEEEDTPVYKTWWFWTIIGGVVVAGAATGTAIAVSSGGGGDTSPPPNINANATVDLDDLF